jgi:hypothetical protein
MLPLKKAKLLLLVLYGLIILAQVRVKVELSVINMEIPLLARCGHVTTEMA